MRTRRSKAGTVTPFANPEKQFRARREVSPAPIHNIYAFYESESSESDKENMYIENLTLEQYLDLDQNNTRRRFTCTDNSTFEIKGQLLRELRKISFLGGPTDSAVEHIQTQDTIPLSPSELAEDKEEFSMTLGDPDKRMSVGLEEFVNIDDMWDDLDPWILSNEKTTTDY
ncbi:hypothetical protein Tco_0454370 [Tanacetum coccineum]